MGTNSPNAQEDPGHGFVSAIRRAFRSRSPIVEDVVARDIAEFLRGDTDEEDSGPKSDISSDAEAGPTLYRPPSLGVAYGPSRPIVSELGPHIEPHPSHEDRKKSREAELELLRESHVLPVHLPAKEEGKISALAVFFRKLLWRDEAESAAGPGEVGGEDVSQENSPLLQRQGRESQAHLNEIWDEAVADDRVRTSWSRETKVLSRYSAPLILAFMMQYSINVTSILAVGRIGKMELGAVSLASMTAVITCYAPFVGFASALDTLCSQAYGAGHRHLVGLQFQRMCYFLLLCFVPISFIWWHGEAILALFVPERRSAELAGQYLRVLIVSGPFSAIHEAGERFVRAQGLFNAGTYVLLVAAPINVFVNWLLVWKLEWGFIGAPAAASFTQILLPFLLFLYVRFVDGYQCWGGFSKRAFVNWGIMIRLAIPDLIMVEAEYMAFEVMTFAASRFGAQYLAAQSIVGTLEAMAYQVPFAISVAGSTRIGNLMGAGLVDAAKISAQMTLLVSAIFGIVTAATTLTLGHRLIWLFTTDVEVAEIANSLLVVVAAVQVLDPYSTSAHGILRGVGRQYVGSYTNLGGFYLVGLPLAFATAWGLGWKVHGMWFGLGVGLTLVAVVELTFAYLMDWNKAAEEAESRNAAG